MKPLSKLLVPHHLGAGGSAAMLALRLVVGAAFVLHGQGKIVHPFGWMGADSTMPAALQFLAALSEFGGGIAFLLGALVPLASFGVACTMAVAVSVHARSGGEFVGKGSYELPLVYLMIAVVFALVGPGRYSVDAWLKRRLAR